MINLMNLNNCSPDVICVQELWHIPDNVNYVLPGYHPLVRTLRNSAQGGGVGIYVKLCFKFSLLHSKSIFIERIFETIVIELEISHNSKIIIGSLYRPGTQHPRLNATQTFEQFIELFSQQLNDLVSSNKTIFLLGDLNLDVLNYNKCAQVTALCRSFVLIWPFTNCY
jgi:exonuclease III